MDGFNYVFDATQYDPQQLAPTHPIGKFMAEIADTDIKPTKENTGGYFEVTFKTEAGRIPMRYNLWNPNVTATDIAHRQLSALCYVTGIFKLNMGNKGAELRGARCSIEVTKQANSEYTQVSRVMDTNGNEPMARGNGAQAPAPQQAQQPPAWNGGAGQGGQPAPQVWSKPADAPPATQAPAQGGAALPWQQQQPATPGANNTPPWASR